MGQHRVRGREGFCVFTNSKVVSSADSPWPETFIVPVAKWDGAEASHWELTPGAWAGLVTTLTPDCRFSRSSSKYCL